MEPSSKNRKLAFVGVGLLAVALVAGKLIYDHRAENPRLVTVNGQGIYLHDADARLSEAERTGNSVELKKQMALNIVQDKILTALAAKEGLSVADFIRKVKQGADTKISDQEFKAYVRDGFPPGKHTSAQLKLYRAGFEERKRDEYFREFMKKAMAEANVKWDN